MRAHKTTVFPPHINRISKFMCYSIAVKCVDYFLLWLANIILKIVCIRFNEVGKIVIFS